jgi:hypothetical protein
MKLFTTNQPVILKHSSRITFEQFESGGRKVGKYLTTLKNLCSLRPVQYKDAKAKVRQIKTTYERNDPHPYALTNDLPSKA